MPMALSVESPYNTCVSIEDVNKKKKMFNDKAVNAMSPISDLSTWTRL